MTTTIRTLQQTLVNQLESWQTLDERRIARKRPDIKVITVSREAGSGGKLVATRVAQALGMSIYDREIIQKVAKRVDMDRAFVEKEDEDTGSLFEDWMSTLVQQRYLVPQKLLRHMKLGPGEYVAHLQKIVEEIATADGGVIVGRGANFLLPEEACLRVRIIAPVTLRVQHAHRLFGTKPAEAHRRLKRREANRRAFIRHHFGKDIADPIHYDLVLNLVNLSLEEAATTILAAWRSIRREADSEREPAQ